MKRENLARALNNHGMSLAEMLIALAISGLVASAAYSVFQSATNASRGSESTTAIQMNLRAAMDLLSRDIRHAGFGLEEVPSTLSIGSGTFKAPIAFVNSSSGPDSLTVVGVGHFAGYLNRTDDADHAGDNLCNEPNDPVICIIDPDGTRSAAEFRIEDSPYTFKAERRYISIAGNFFMELASSQSPTDLDKGRLTLAASSMRVNGNYKNADRIPVYIIQALQYSIATDLTGCSVTIPCLAVQDFSTVRGTGRQVVAQHIEDLQVAYGVDANPRDGRIDYPASGYTAAAFESAPVVDPLSIVALRVSLIGRSPLQNSSDSSASSARPALEDRPAGTQDRYSRRSLTKVIKIRNPRS